MAGEGCGYGDEGEKVFGFAFVAAVEPAAASEPGHSALDHPSVAAEPLRGLDAFAGDAVADAALVEPSAQVAVVVALVGVQFRREPPVGAAVGTDGRDAAHERLKVLAVMHVGAGDPQGERQPIPVGDQVDLRSRVAAIGRIRSRQRPPFCSPQADGADCATRPIQVSASTEFIEDDAVAPGPDAGPAPLGQSPVDRLPARADHRWELRHVQPEVATKMIAARASRSPARRRPSPCGRLTSVVGTTRRNSTHNSCGTRRSTRSVRHGSTNDHAIRSDLAPGVSSREVCLMAACRAPRSGHPRACAPSVF